MDQKQYIQEDEIDLRELFNTIVKNKKLIIIFTSIITILAALYAFLKTPIYEVKSNVQIGYVGENLVAAPSTIIKTARVVFNVDDKIENEKPYISNVSNISSNKKIKNFIEIKTEAISNEEALKLNKKVINYIQEKYQPFITEFIDNNRNEIDAIQKQIDDLDNFEAANLKREIELLKKQDIVKIDEKIKFYKTVKTTSLLEKIKFHKSKLKDYTNAIRKIYNHNKNTKDTALLSIASMQIVNYQNLILNSQNKIEDFKLEITKIKDETIPNLKMEKNNIENDKIRKLQYKLDVELANNKKILQESIKQLKFKSGPAYVQNTKVIGEYVMHDYAVKPKKKLIIVVAFITGLILSIFLIFFLEFIRDDKNISVK